MHKSARLFVSLSLMIILLFTACIASAGTRTESDPAHEEYRYVISTTAYSPTTITLQTRQMSSYYNMYSTPQTITRKFTDGRCSWGTAIGTHAQLSDLTPRPGGYNVSSVNSASFTVTVRPHRHVYFLGYKKQTTWEWQHFIQHQRREANSTEWKTIDTSTSYSKITKKYTTFGYTDH